MLNNLYAQTPMESTFEVVLLTIDGGTPGGATGIRTGAASTGNPMFEQNTARPGVDTRRHAEHATFT